MVSFSAAPDRYARPIPDVHTSSNIILQSSSRVLGVIMKVRRWAAFPHLASLTTSLAWILHLSQHGWEDATNRDTSTLRWLRRRNPLDSISNFCVTCSYFRIKNNKTRPNLNKEILISSDLEWSWRLDPIEYRISVVVAFALSRRLLWCVCLKGTPPLQPRRPGTNCKAQSQLCGNRLLATFLPQLSEYWNYRQHLPSLVWF